MRRLQTLTLKDTGVTPKYCAYPSANIDTLVATMIFTLIVLGNTMCSTPLECVQKNQSNIGIQ